MAIGSTLGIQAWILNPNLAIGQSVQDDRDRRIQKTFDKVIFLCYNKTIGSRLLVKIIRVYKG
ncbi:hypothetical protein A2810_02985 [candidate division Kazan bacterium RIFCSPHIGHO2_01_FULL_49_10]|nr:MAG: hypothetical protein A2810_02985 [candidate division Kazan bacterium RIFCSPHIGHO2_01_FULL_49_10]